MPGTADRPNGARFLADLLSFATQQTGVAATITTIYVLADKIGAERSILVGLLIGLGTAALSALVRSAVNPGPPTNRPHAE